MKMYKNITKLLAIIMVLAMIGGCSASKNLPDEAAGTAAGTTTQQTQTTATAENVYKGEMPISKDLIKLSFVTHSGHSASRPPADNKLLFWSETQKATNVEIQWEVLAKDKYAEVLTTRLSSGVDLPDLVNLSGVGVSRIYQTGILMPLNDLLDKYGYYINQWLEDGHKEYRSMWTQADGNIYAIPTYENPTFYQIYPMYNRLWLKEIGYEIPTTIAELEELLYAMKGVDFNKNGKNDEIILTAANIHNLNHFSSSWGLEIFHWGSGYQADKDGKVTWGYASDRYREFLTFFNKLAMDGILDKEISTNSYNVLFEKAAADVLGVIMCYQGFSINYSRLNPYGSAHPDEENVFQCGPPLKGPYGDQYLIEKINNSSDPCAITKDCKNPEAAMKWLSYVYASRESSLLRKFGVKDVNYTIDENGEIKIIYIPEGFKTISDYMTSEGGVTPPMCYISVTEFAKVTDEKWEYDFNMAMQKYFKKGILPTAWTSEERKIYDKYYLDLQNYAHEQELKFIFGQRSLDEWDKYLAALKNLHMDEVLAIFQSRHTRYLEKGY